MRAKDLSTTMATAPGERDTRNDGLTPDRLDDENLKDVPPEHRYNDNLSRIRRQRNIAIGAVSGTAATLLLGGGLWLGQRMGGDEETAPPTTQSGEVEPGQQVDPNGEVLVEDNSESVGGENPTSPETAPEPYNVMLSDHWEMSNEEIINAYTLDLRNAEADRDYTLNFMRDIGANEALIDAPAWLDTYNSENGAYSTFTIDDDNVETRFFGALENNLLAFSNVVIANPEPFSDRNHALNYRVGNGAASTIIDEIAAQGMDCKSDCVRAVDDPAISAVINAVQEFPEGSAVTRFSIVGVADERALSQQRDPGIGAKIEYRTPDGENSNAMIKLTDTALPNLESPGVMYDSHDETLSTWNRFDNPTAAVYLPHVPEN